LAKIKVADIHYKQTMANHYPKSNISGRRLAKERVAPNIQRVVREVDSSALKQFLSGYIRFHPELNTSIKLLLGVQVGEVAGVDEIYGFIDDLWRKNRRKLGQKRSQKKLEFLLLSSVGVSADALSEKNYQLAAAQSLAMHQWMTDVGEELQDSGWAIRLYRQLLEVIQGLFKSDMAPQLMNEMIKGLIRDYEKAETRPYGGEDIWCRLYQSGRIDEDKFAMGLMQKLSKSDDPLAFFPSFLEYIELTTAEQREKVLVWVRAVPALEVLDQLEQADVILNNEALFFIISVSEKWTYLQREALAPYLQAHQKLIIDLHHDSIESPGSVWQELKQRSNWSEKEENLLIAYRQKMSSQKMMAFAIDQLLADAPLSMPEIEQWEWEDRLRILPFITKEERKSLLKDFKSYCLDYAENHMGQKAIDHIRDLGRILMHMNYHNDWSKVRTALQREFGYRKSFQHW